MNSPICGEVEDGGEPVADVALGKTEELGALEDVLPAREVGLKPGAELEQRHHAPAHLERPRCRIEGPGEDLQQRALPRAVDADDPQAFARSHLEADVAQRPEFLVTSEVAERHPFEQAVAGTRVELESLSEIAHRHHHIAPGWVAHRTSRSSGRSRRRTR